MPVSSAPGRLPARLLGEAGVRRARAGAGRAKLEFISRIFAMITSGSSRLERRKSVISRLVPREVAQGEKICAAILRSELAGLAGSGPAQRRVAVSGAP